MPDADPTLGLGLALEHHQAGRHHDAEPLYRQALEASPDDPTALYLYGLFNFETGRADAAVELMRKVTSLRPDHAEARLTLARMLHWRGDHADAATAYRAAIDLEPQRLDAWLGLSDALRDQGEQQAALAACESALAIDPASAAGHAAMGALLSRMGRGQESVAAYRRAVALEPALAAAQIGLALALLAEGLARDAEREAITALALDPSSADAWFVRGVALTALQRPAEALLAMEHCVRLDPDRAAARLNLGNLYGEFERGEEAIVHLHAAIALDPTLIEAHASLSSLYLLTGQKELAEASCRTVLAQAPDMVTAHQNLASLLDEKGDADAARAHRDAAYRQQNLFIETAHDPRRRVLVLTTSRSGNVPYKFLLPKNRYTRISWVIEYAPAGQAEQLPDYDLVFNAIGDPDLSGPTDAAVAAFMRGCGKPGFNDPAKVTQTFRHLTPALLADIPGLVVPQAIRIDATALAAKPLAGHIADAGLTWPVLVRPIGSHGGKGLIRAQGPQDLADVPTANDLYVTQYQDYCGADGFWRKYRVIFIDRTPYAYHAAISDNWLVHYESAGMLGDAIRLAEEEAFLDDPRGALGDEVMNAVAAIGRRLDLDYCGVDFTVLPNSQVLVFEANATMLTHTESEDGPLAHKNRYVRRILDAFEAMITRD